MNRYTKLMAVNRILRAASEAPVNSLDEAPTNENLLALQILDEVILERLLRGVSNNMFVREFTPDDDGFIFLPNNTLSAEAWYLDVKMVLTTTGTGTIGDPYKLYNVTDDTDVFESPVTLRVITLLDFEDITPAEQKAIVDIASAEYEAATVGDPSRGQQLSRQSMISQAEAKANDMRLKRRNLFDARARTNGPRMLRTVKRPWN